MFVLFWCTYTELGSSRTMYENYSHYNKVFKCSKIVKDNLKNVPVIYFNRLPYSLLTFKISSRKKKETRVYHSQVFLKKYPLQKLTYHYKRFYWILHLKSFIAFCKVVVDMYTKHIHLNYQNILLNISISLWRTLMYILYIISTLIYYTFNLKLLFLIITVFHDHLKNHFKNIRNKNSKSNSNSSVVAYKL